MMTKLGENKQTMQYTIISPDSLISPKIISEGRQVKAVVPWTDYDSVISQELGYFWLQKNASGLLEYMAIHKA